MTELEQQLRTTYAERLGALEPPLGDAAAARRTGARMRARRRLVVGSAATAVVALAVGGTLVGTGRVAVGPSHDRGLWREVPAAPLTPRANALAVWSGREVVVVGGESDPCPPNVDGCASGSEGERDGAAYDPASNTWRSIAPSPVPVGPGDRLVAADGVVVLRHWLAHGSRWFAYEPDRNRWSAIDDVPARVGDLPSANGSDVYVPAGRRIAVYDVARSEWRLLPPDPHTPRLSQRRVTATPYGPVVTGYVRHGPGDGSVSTSPVVADVYDGTTWRRLPRSGIAGNDWSWVGDRMVDFDSFDHQGMPGTPGLSLGGLLDPSSGRWSPLPDSALETPEHSWSAVAIGPGPWAACWGLVYDVADGRAWTLPRPPGAPDRSTSAAWVGDSLFVFGGGDQTGGSHTTNRAWVYTP